MGDSFWPNRINNCSNSNNSYNQLTQLRRYHHLSLQWPNAAQQRPNSLSRRSNRIIPPLNCRLSSSHAYSQRSLSSNCKDSGVIPSQQLRNIPLPNKISPQLILVSHKLIKTYQNNNSLRGGTADPYFPKRLRYPCPCLSKFCRKYPPTW